MPIRRRRFFAFAVPIMSLIGFSPRIAPHGRDDELAINTAKAPIVPDGTTAGAATNFVVTFADVDPDVPGIGIRTGGTISVTLPAGFVRHDPAAPMAMVVLQGWPQSSRRPFPDVTYDADTNTLIATMRFDHLPDTSAQPGPKQVHLLLPGFANPPAGTHRVELTIQPDLAADTVLTGSGDVTIHGGVPASINAISVVNPPPPFPNPVYQTVAPDTTLHLWGFYLWQHGGDPHIGVHLIQESAQRYQVVDAAGDEIGSVSIRAPQEAADASLDADASFEVEVEGAVLGISAGLLRAQFHPDPDTPGDYEIIWRLLRGNDQHMFVTVTPG